MIAVFNTTLLRYTIAIEQEHLLGQLFEKVLVSAAVQEELIEPRTSENAHNRVVRDPNVCGIQQQDRTGYHEEI